jgi:hypothetical protein
MQKNYPNTIIYDFEPGDVVTIHRTWGEKKKKEGAGNEFELYEGFQERYVGTGPGDRTNLWDRTLTRITADRDDLRDIQGTYQKLRVIMVILDIKKRNIDAKPYKIIKGRVTHTNFGIPANTILTFRLCCDTNYIVSNNFRKKTDLCNPREAAAPLNIHHAPYLAGETNHTATQIANEPGEFDKWKTSNIVANQYGKKWDYDPLILGGTKTLWGDKRKREPDAHWCTWFELVNEDGQNSYLFGNISDIIEWNCWTMILTAQGSLIKYIKDVAIKSNGRVSMIGDHGFFTAGLQKHQTRYQDDESKTPDYDTGTPLFSKNVVFLKTEAENKLRMEGEDDRLWTFYPYQGLTGESKNTLDDGQKLAAHQQKAYRIICKRADTRGFPVKLNERNWIVTWDENDLYDGHEPGIHFEWDGKDAHAIEEDIKMPTSFFKFVSTQRAGAIRVVLSEFNQHLREDYTKAQTKETSGMVLFSRDHPGLPEEMGKAYEVLREKNYVDAQYSWTSRGPGGTRYDVMITYYHLTMGVIHDKVNIVVNGKDNSQQNHFRFLPRTWIPDIADGLKEDGRLYNNFLKSLVSIRDTDKIDPIFDFDTMWRGILIRGMDGLFNRPHEEREERTIVPQAGEDVLSDARAKTLQDCKKTLRGLIMEDNGKRILNQYFEWSATVPDWVVSIDPNDKILQRILGSGTSYFMTPKWVRLYNNNESPVFPYGYSWIPAKADDAQIRYVEVATPTFSIKPQRYTLVNANTVAKPNILSKIRPGSTVYIGFGPNVGDTFKYSLGVHEPIGYTFFRGNNWETTEEDNKYVVLNSDLKLKAMRRIRREKKLKEQAVSDEGGGRSIQFTAKEVAATLCSVNTQLNPVWMEQLFLTHEHKTASPDWNFADRIESRVEEFWEECENQIVKFYSVPRTWTLRNFLWELVAQHLLGDEGKKIYSSEFNINELLKRVYSIKIYYSTRSANSTRLNMFAGPQIRNRIQMPSEFYDFDTFHEGLKYEIVLNMLTEDKLNMSMGNILQYGGYFQEEMSNYSEGSPAAIGAKSFKIDIITRPLEGHTTTKIKVKAIFPGYIPYITSMTTIDSIWKSGRENYKQLRKMQKQAFFRNKETNPTDLIYELHTLLPPNTNTVRKPINRQGNGDYEVEYIPDEEIITILNNKHKAQEQLSKKGGQRLQNLPSEIKRLVNENKALDKQRRNEVLYHWGWMKRFLIPDGCEFLLIENPDRLVECRAWWESREGDIIPSPYPYFTTYNNPISRWKKGSVERELVPSELGPGKFVEMWNSLSMEQAIIEVEKDNFGKVGLLMKHYVYSKIGKQLNNAHNIFISLPQGQKINVLSLFLGHSARPKKQHPDLKRKVSDEVFTTAQDGEIDFLSSKGLYIHELKYLNIENPCWFSRYNYTSTMHGFKITFIPNEAGIVNIVSRYVYKSIEVKKNRLKAFNQGSSGDYPERTSDVELIGKTTVQNIVERVYEMSLGEDAAKRGGIFIINGEEHQPFPNTPLTRNWNDVWYHFNKITISVAGKGTYNLYENGSYNNSLFYVLGLKEKNRSGDEPFGIKLVRTDRLLDLGFKDIEITFHSKEVNSETRDIVEKLELDTLVTQKEEDLSRRGYIYIDGETRTLLNIDNQYNPKWSLLTKEMLNFLVSTYNLKTPGESGYELPYTAVEDFEDMIFKPMTKTTGSPGEYAGGIPQVAPKKKIPNVKFMTKLERIEQVCGLLATKHVENLPEAVFRFNELVEKQEWDLIDDDLIDASIEWRDTTCMACQQPGATVRLECGIPDPKEHQTYKPHKFHMSCLYKNCLKRPTWDENIGALTEAAPSINILHKINLDQYMTCVTIPEAYDTNVAIRHGGIPPDKQYVSTVTVRTFLQIRAQMKIKNAGINATYIPMDAIQAVPIDGGSGRYFIDAGIDHRREIRGYLNMNHLNEDEKYIGMPELKSRDRLVGRHVQIQKSRDRDITYTSEDAPATVEQVPVHKMALEHMHQKIYTWTENSHCPACRTLVGTRVLTCRPIGFETHKNTLMYCGREVYEEESLKDSFPPLIKNNHGGYEWEKYRSKWALFRYQPHARAEVHLDGLHGRGGLELAYHELSQFIENKEKFQTNNSPTIYTPCRYAKLIGKKQKLGKDITPASFMESRYRTYRLKSDDGYIDLPDILKPYDKIKDNLTAWLAEAENYLILRDQSLKKEATEWWRESFLDVAARFPDTVDDSGTVDLIRLPNKWTFQPIYAGGIFRKPRITIGSDRDEATIRDLVEELIKNMRRTYNTYEIEFEIPDSFEEGQVISLGLFGFRDAWPQTITLKEEDKDVESDAKWKIYSMPIFKTNPAEETEKNNEFNKLVEISSGLWKLMGAMWQKTRERGSDDVETINKWMRVFEDKGPVGTTSMAHTKNAQDIYVPDEPMNTTDGKTWMAWVQQWFSTHLKIEKLSEYFKLKEKYSKKVITKIEQLVNLPATVIYPGLDMSAPLTDVIKRPAKMNKKDTFAYRLPWPYVGENCRLMVYVRNKPDKSDTRIKIKVEFRYAEDDSLIQANKASATVVDVGLEDNMDSFWESMKRTQWFQNQKAWMFKNGDNLPLLSEGGRLLFDLEPGVKRGGKPYYDANTRNGTVEYLNANPWPAHCNQIHLGVSSEDVYGHTYKGSMMKTLFRPARRKEEAGGGIVQRTWKHEIDSMHAIDELDTIGDDISRDNKLIDSSIGIQNPWFVSQDSFRFRPYRDDSCTKKYLTMKIYYNKRDRFEYDKFVQFPWYNDVIAVTGYIEHRLLAQVEIKFKDRKPGVDNWVSPSSWVQRPRQTVIPLKLLKMLGSTHSKEEDILRLYNAIGTWGGAHRDPGAPPKRKWFADDLKPDDRMAYTDSELVAITTQYIDGDDEMPKEKLLWAHASFNFRKLDHWAIKNKWLVIPQYTIIEKIRDENRLKVLPWHELTQAGINIVFNVSKIHGARIKVELEKSLARATAVGGYDILDSRNINAFSKSRFSLSLTNPSIHPDINKPTGWLTPEMIAINGKENTERVIRDGVHSDASESLIDQFEDAMPWTNEYFGLFDKDQLKRFKSLKNKNEKRLIFTLYRDVNQTKTDVAPVPHPQSIRFEFLDVSKHLKPSEIEGELEWGKANEVFVMLKQNWKSSCMHEMLLPVNKNPTLPYGFTDGQWPAFLEDLKQVYIMEVVVSNDYEVYQKKDDIYTLVEVIDDKYELLQEHVSYVATIIKRSRQNNDWDAIEFLHLKNIDHGGRYNEDEMEMIGSLPQNARSLDATFSVAELGDDAVTFRKTWGAPYVALDKAWSVKTDDVFNATDIFDSTDWAGKPNINLNRTCGVSSYKHQKIPPKQSYGQLSYRDLDDPNCYNIQRGLFGEGFDKGGKRHPNHEQTPQMVIGVKYGEEIIIRNMKNIKSVKNFINKPKEEMIFKYYKKRDIKPGDICTFKSDENTSRVRRFLVMGLDEVMRQDASPVWFDFEVYIQIIYDSNGLSHEDRLFNGTAVPWKEIEYFRDDFKKMRHRDPPLFPYFNSFPVPMCMNKEINEDGGIVLYQRDIGRETVPFPRCPVRLLYFTDDFQAACIQYVPDEKGEASCNDFFLNRSGDDPHDKTQTMSVPIGNLHPVNIISDIFSDDEDDDDATIVLDESDRDRLSDSATDSIPNEEDIQHPPPGGGGDGTMGVYGQDHLTDSFSKLKLRF